MVKTICTLMGVLLCLIGVSGFIDGRFMGTHLDTVQNLLHVISGAIAIYFGLKSEFAARKYCQVFGLIYGSLALAGFLCGPGTFTLHPSTLGDLQDAHLFKVLPGHLEFGAADHGVHLFLALILCATGFIRIKSKSRTTPVTAAAPRVRETAGVR